MLLVHKVLQVLQGLQGKGFKIAAYIDENGPFDPQGSADVSTGSKNPHENYRQGEREDGEYVMIKFSDGYNGNDPRSSGRLFPVRCFSFKVK